MTGGANEMTQASNAAAARVDVDPSPPATMAGPDARAQTPRRRPCLPRGLAGGNGGTTSGRLVSGLTPARPANCTVVLGEDNKLVVSRKRGWAAAMRGEEEVEDDGQLNIETTTGAHAAAAAAAAVVECDRHARAQRMGG